METKKALVVFFVLLITALGFGYRDRLEKAKSTGGGYDYVLAAQNSSERLKDKADLVCPGTSDEDIINTCLANDPNGSNVLLLPGIYYIDGTITIYGSCTLEGSGMAVTAATNEHSAMIKLETNANCTLVDFTNRPDIAHNFFAQMKNITLDGNYSAQSGAAAGVIIDGSDIVLDRVFLVRVNGDGVAVGSGAWNINILNCWIETIKRRGLVFNNTNVSRVFNTYFNNIGEQKIVGYTGAIHLESSCTNISFVECQVKRSVGEAIVITDGSNLCPQYLNFTDFIIQSASFGNEGTYPAIKIATSRQAASNYNFINVQVNKIAGDANSAADVNISTLAGGGGITPDYINFVNCQFNGKPIQIEAGANLHGQWVSCLNAPLTVPTKVATVEGIDATATGATTLYTVPTGRTFIPTKKVIRCTSFTAGGKGTQAVASSGGNDATYDDYLNSQTYTVTAANTSITDSATGEVVIQAAGDVFKIIVETASDATTETWAVDLFGYLN